MDAKSLIKVVVILFAVAAALPFALKLVPEPLAFGSVQKGFEAAAVTVQDYALADTPGLGAVRQAGMTLFPPGAGGELAVYATLYEFDNEGKIAKQYEYNKPDPGAQMVENFNLSNIAAGVGRPRPPRPVGVGRNGMLLLVVTSDSKEAIRRVVDIFEAL